MDATISSLSGADLKPPKRSLPSSPTPIDLEGKFPNRQKHKQPGILVLNREGRILFSNREVQNIFDFAEKDVLRKSTEDAPLQEILFDFFPEKKQRSGLGEKNPNPPLPAPDKRTFLHRGRFYQVRSIPLSSHGRTRRDVYLLLSIEEIGRDPRAVSFHRRRRRPN